MLWVLVHTLQHPIVLLISLTFSTYRFEVGSQLRDLSLHKDSSDVAGVRRLEEISEEERRYFYGKWHDTTGQSEFRYVCETIPIILESTGTIGCEPGWAEFRSSCYRLHTEAAKFASARKSCLSEKGGNLVIITSEEENEHVRKVCLGDIETAGVVAQEDRAQPCWIGLFETKGRWIWEDESGLAESGYENWADEQPDNDNKKVNACAMMLPEGNPWDMTWPTIVIVIVVFVWTVVPVVTHGVFAWQYKKMITERRPEFPQVNGIPSNLSMTNGNPWGFGVCDSCPCQQPLFGDCDMCLHGCFCMGARAGDTHQTAGTGSFWCIWFLVEGAYLLAAIFNVLQKWIMAMLAVRVELDWGWLLMGAIIASVMTGKRQALRERLGGKRKECCHDCLLYWCCYCCVTCQEAKQIDAIQGVQVRCCCQSMQTPTNTITVQPVSSQVIGMPVSEAWAPPVGQPVVIATPVVPNGQYNPKQGVVQAVPVQPKVV